MADPVEGSVVDPAVATAAAAAVPAPVVETPAAPAPEVAAAPAAVDPIIPATGAAPWDKDVAEAFADPTQQAAVSEFMRSKYQPYVTGIEQERATLRERALLFDQFEEDSDATMREVAAELYGEGVANEIAAVLAKQGIDPDAPAETPPAAAESRLTKDEQEAIAWAQQQRASSVEASQMDAYLSDAKPYLEANGDIPEAMFHSLAASTGSFEKAVDMYRLSFPAPAAEGETPPATLGAGQTGVSERKKYATLGDATDAMFEAMKL